MFGEIQTSQTWGQPYSGVSPSVSVLWLEGCSLEGTDVSTGLISTFQAIGKTSLLHCPWSGQCI